MMKQHHPVSCAHTTHRATRNAFDCNDAELMSGGATVVGLGARSKTWASSLLSAPSWFSGARLSPRSGGDGARTRARSQRMLPAFLHSDPATLIVQTDGTCSSRLAPHTSRRKPAQEIRGTEKQHSTQHSTVSHVLNLNACLAQQPPQRGRPIQAMQAAPECAGGVSRGWQAPCEPEQGALDCLGGICSASPRRRQQVA